MLKRKIGSASVAAIAAAMVIGGTGAYFTTSDQAHNVITTAGVDIELIEVTDQQDDNGDPIPFADVTDAMPGDEISKIPMVKNIENQGVWTRVKVLVTVQDAEGEAMSIPDGLLDIDYNTTDWTLGDDGFWYYNTELSGGDTSAPLFEHVIFSTSMGNEYQKATVKVDLDAQAVQAANNGSTAEDATGWPE